MPRLFEPSPADLAAHEEWLASRPAHIRAVARRIDPWTPYRLKTTGQIVGLHSICGPAPPQCTGVTVKVRVLKGHNLNFLVFGIDPDDLEPYEADPYERVELLRMALRDNPVLQHALNRKPDTRQ